MPGRHLSPTQQPLQLSGPQRAVVHAPEVMSHARPCTEQSVHEAPPTPHAFASMPETQRSTPELRSQHPRQLAQPERLHVFWLPHVSKPVAAQSEHALPS